jgi:hypothetical protein
MVTLDTQDTGCRQTNNLLFQFKFVFIRNCTVQELSPIQQSFLQACLCKKRKIISSVV